MIESFEECAAFNTLAPRLLASSIRFLETAKFSALFDVAVIWATAINDEGRPIFTNKCFNLENDG